MLIPYKHWLLAKKQRKERILREVAKGSWDRDMVWIDHEFASFDALPDVVHSAEYDSAFLGTITGLAEVDLPSRCRAVLCDVATVDSKGHDPKGE